MRIVSEQELREEELSLTRGRGNEYKTTTDNTTYGCNDTTEIDWNCRLFAHLT